MQFDVIEITEEEIKELSVVQMKMLRTAQQKKDELLRKAGKELKQFRAMMHTVGMENSTLIASKTAEVESELEYQSNLIAENLIYNLSINEPTSGDDIGGEGGDESAGYIVDYTLSYAERYAIVRDYYLAIEDPAERIALYSADEVAKKYLSTYYSTLFDLLYNYSR